MRKRRWRRLLITLGVILAVNYIAGLVIGCCAFRTKLSRVDDLSIVTHLPAGLYPVKKLTALPVRESKSVFAQLDLRSRDLSSLDIRGRESDLFYADFNSRTVWPAMVSDLPIYKPERIMELGRTPGLGVRSLHKRGITGKGVGLAIIDQGLLVDHVEYKDRVRLYEEIHCSDGCATMHGAAVASIAVGKTVGVAPEADLYYIAETHMKTTPLGIASIFIPGVGMMASMDFGTTARSINRIVDINKRLPKKHRIRVLSISVDWYPWMSGGWAADRAVRRAEEAGILILTTCRHGNCGGQTNLQGLGRSPLDDPDKPSSYGPGMFWGDVFFRVGSVPRGTLLVPMDSRCTASPTGVNDYVFYRQGGLSWSVPYLASLYALACQVKPDVTPSEFWKAALDTGNTVQLTKNGKTYRLGKVVNPVKIIDRLQPPNA